MAKPIKKVIEYPKTSAEMFTRLKQLSIKYDGAWIANVMPFSHETHYQMYKSRSAVPDYFVDITRGKIFVKGKLVTFTDAAIYREQQRGYSGDR